MSAGMDGNYSARVENILGSTTAVSCGSPWSMLPVQDDRMSVAFPPRPSGRENNELMDEMKAGSAIEERESVHEETSAVAAVVERRGETKGEKEVRQYSILPGTFRYIHLVIGRLQSVFWVRPICMLRSVARKLMAMIARTCKN